MGIYRYNNFQADTYQSEPQSTLTHDSESPQKDTVNDTEFDLLRITNFSNFAILNPIHRGISIPPPKSEVIFTRDIVQIASIYKLQTKLLSIDIETRGTNPRLGEVVGIGFAATGLPCAYMSISIPTDYEDIINFLQQFVLDGGRLLGFNITFEKSFLRNIGGWEYDIFGMFKQLANEGWNGQRWGLKSAQIQLLNWDSKGDIDLVDWLVRNGYYSATSHTAKSTFVEMDGVYYNPKRGEMWRAPADILGYYCALDAYSTLEILHRVILPSIEGKVWRDTFLQYHTHLFIPNVTEAVRNQLEGFTVDLDMVTEYSHTLQPRLDCKISEILARSEFIQFANELREWEIEKLKGKMPEKLTKGGKISKNWENMQNKIIILECRPEAEFINLGSGPQLQHLFYEQLSLPVIIRTKKGGPSVGVKAMRGFGELGKLLLEKRKIEKELGYVAACISHIKVNNYLNSVDIPEVIEIPQVQSGNSEEEIVN